MEVIQVIKKLNNTELGKGGTKDRYVLVPKNLDVLEIFPEAGKEISFKCKKNGESINIRKTEGREVRIVGLGGFYRKYNLCAGDQLLLEHRIINGKSEYYIDFEKKQNTIVFQKSKHGLEILEITKIMLLTEPVWMEENGERLKLELEFLEEKKKREDSPEKTRFYDMKIGGKSLCEKIKKNTIIEIEINGEEAKLNKVLAWKKYKFKVGENNE